MNDNIAKIEEIKVTKQRATTITMVEEGIIGAIPEAVPVRMRITTISMILLKIISLILLLSLF